MKISEIRDTLKAEVLVGNDQLDKSVEAGGGADLMADVLSAVAKGAVLLTGLTTEQVLRTAKVAGVALVVFVRGKRPDEPVIELARTYNMPVLLTKYFPFRCERTALHERFARLGWIMVRPFIFQQAMRAFFQGTGAAGSTPARVCGAAFFRRRS